MKTKFNLDDIIDVIGSPIKKNCLCLGIDVAQIKTGMCLLRTDEKFLYIEGMYILIAKKDKNTLHQMVDKWVHEAIQLRGQVEKDSKDIKKHILIIEDCWFSKSVWTTKILSKFAVLAYLVFRKWATEAPDPIQPVTARKRIGFKKDTKDSTDTKKQVYNYLAEEFDLEIEDNDLADAYVLALAGLVEVDDATV
jgi:hypothetical protein